MATGMLGANTDELRALAGVYQQKAEAARQAESTTVPEVDGVRWEGQDADAFRQRYRGEVAPTMTRLAEMLEDAKSELERQAQEQDDCSDGKGGVSGSGSGQGFGLGDAWGLWKNLTKLAKAGRFLMEAGYLLKNLDFAKDFFTGGANWARLTGWTGMFDEAGKAIKMADNLEDLAKQAVPGYRFMAGATDFFQFKWLSNPLEKMLPQGWQNTISDAFGKSGRVAGKGLSVLGAVMDGAEAFNAFKDGHVWTGADGSFTSGGAWNTAQAIAGGLTLVPGPVGWVAGGVSLAMAGTELVVQNWDSIKNFAGNVAEGAGQVMGGVVDGAKSVVSALNPFD